MQILSKLKQDTGITVLPSTSTVNIKLYIKFPWDISNICEYILITRLDYIYIGIHEGPHFRISSIAKLSREFFPLSANESGYCWTWWSVTIQRLTISLGCGSSSVKLCVIFPPLVYEIEYELFSFSRVSVHCHCCQC